MTWLRDGRPTNCSLIVGSGKRYCYVQTSPRAHPASYLIGKGRSPPPEVRRLGCEANNSPPRSAEAKNGRSCTSASPYVLLTFTVTASRYLSQCVTTKGIEFCATFPLFSYHQLSILRPTGFKFRSGHRLA